MSILLEGKEAGEVELTISYVVHSASWVPSYDVRVYTQGKKAELTLQYYGQVGLIDSSLALIDASNVFGGPTKQRRRLEGLQTLSLDGSTISRRQHSDSQDSSCLNQGSDVSYL